jgi:hypothetical protein
MGKGRQQAPGDQVVRQTNLPEYADPYFRRLLQGAEESLVPFQPRIDPETGQVAIDPNTGMEMYDTTYQAYPGERIAPSAMYGDIGASRAMVRGIAETGIAGMPEAMGAARYGMGYGRQGLSTIADASQYEPGTFEAFDPTRYEGFREAEFTPFGGFEQFQFRGPAEFSDFEFRPDYQFQQFQYQQPERFTGGAVQEYMSPYMQSVVEQQQRQAQLEFERQGAGRAAQAVQAGAFGGSRQAVQEALAEEALGRQMGDIQARGSQAAFEQAAQMFGLDRAARMEAERAQAGEFARVQSGAAAEQARVDQARFTELASREQAQAAEFARAGDQAAAEAARFQAAKFQDLARIQAGKASEMGRVQGAQAAENARMDALMQQEMARVQAAQESSRQFAAGQALAGGQALMGAAGQYAGLGAGLAGLGQQQRAADIQGAQLLETIGRDVRAEDQARLDMSYEDFVRQRDFPIQQYERMAGILRGVPVTPNVEEQRMVSYSPTQQALGAGISALGLYKGLTA